MVGSPGPLTEATVRRQLQIAITLQCAESIGASEEVVEKTAAYALHRVAFRTTHRVIPGNQTQMCRHAPLAEHARRYVLRSSCGARGIRGC